MRATSLILAGVFLAVLARSQTTPPEITSHEAEITFSSKVNLVSVPVVVRDKLGRAVGNLKQDDFQLFDKGKAQVITKFSIETSTIPATSSARTAEPEPAQPGATKPALPERYIAYLFDDIHLQRGDLLQTRLAVNRHLDEALEPRSRAAVFTTSGRMMADFTDDREKLHKAVNSILPWTSGPDSQQDCPSVTYYLADILANKTLYLSGFLFTDEQIGGMIMNGQGGSELQAVASEAVACSGNSSDMTKLAREIRTAVHRALEFGNRETSFSLGAVKDIIRRMSVMPGSRTIVLVSPGFLLATEHRSGEYDVMDHAIKANVTINTIDMRGLYTMPGVDASQRGFGSSAGGALMQAAIAEASTMDDVLAEFADGTGGTFFHNDNGLKEGLNLLAARPEYIYVLGFSPNDLKYDGSYHALKVKVAGARDATLQVRRGYWAPNHAVNTAEETRDAVREAVFSRDEVLDIPVDLQTEFFKSSDSGDAKAELTVSGRLDTSALKFKKADDRNNDTVTVVSGLFDADGNYISGMRRVLELRLRDQTLNGLQNSGIKVKETFNIAPGRYIVRMVVWDGEGHTMAARNKGVEIP